MSHDHELHQDLSQGSQPCQGHCRNEKDADDPQGNLSRPGVMAGFERVSKLKWLCRRGMKELDILLERFILENEFSLSAGSWPEFEAMLACEDDQLWDWFQHPAEADERYSKLVMRISSGPG